MSLIGTTGQDKTAMNKLNKFNFKKIARGLHKGIYTVILGIEGDLKNTKVTFIVASDGCPIYSEWEAPASYQEAIDLSVQFCKVFKIDRDKELVPQIENYQDMIEDIGIGIINISNTLRK